MHCRYSNNPEWPNINLTSYNVIHNRSKSLCLIQEKMICLVKKTPSLIIENMRYRYTASTTFSILLIFKRSMWKKKLPGPLVLQSRHVMNICLTKPSPANWCSKVIYSLKFPSEWSVQMIFYIFLQYQREKRILSKSNNTVLLNLIILRNQATHKQSL